MMRSLKLFLLLLAAVSLVSAGTLVSENFDDITLLNARGWASADFSTAVGTNGWFQGNDGIFAAYEGAPTSYMAANAYPFTTGSIDLWSFTPEIPLDGSITMTFFTRTEVESAFPDRLMVYFSPNGASTDIADFIPVSDLNGGYVVGGYPEYWGQIGVMAIGYGGTGRFALRYLIDDISVHGDYIGIDSLEITQDLGGVPEPAALGLAGLGLLALGLIRRKRG